MTKVLCLVLAATVICLSSNAKNYFSSASDTISGAYKNAYSAVGTYGAQAKKKVTDTVSSVGYYGGEGIAVLNALATQKPIKGFALTVPQYEAASKQASPLSLGQERALLEKKLSLLDTVNQDLPITERESDNFDKNMVASESVLGNQLALDSKVNGKIKSEIESKSDMRKLYEEEIAMLDAIEKYSPLLYLHPDDMAGPVAPQDFFAGQTTSVREGKGSKKEAVKTVIPAGQATFEKLSTLTQQNPSQKYHIWHGVPGNENVYDDRILYGSNPALYDGAIPMHVVTFYDKIKTGTDALGKPVYQTDENGYFIPNKEFFYIQYLCLYGYNQPYDIAVPLGTIYKGDARDFQNAHEGDLEHITMKINAKTGKMVAIYHGSHGGDEGMWMYPPGSTGNTGNEFDVVSAVTPEGKVQERPIIYSAFGGHGNYPKEGVYTRVYGLANDLTAKGPLWKLTKNNIYRTVRKQSAGFDSYNRTCAATPDMFAYLDWKGNLGPRGVSSFIEKNWAGNSEGEDKGRNALAVHAQHFCAGKNPDKACVRNKSKASPPPGNTRPWYVEMLQKLGVF